jgi:hypothetical protein
MEPYLWWNAVVKARLWFDVGGGGSLCGSLKRTGWFRAGAQPYLGARTVESGDMMIDRVLIARTFAVARSLEAVQADGRWRQAPFGSRPQTSS